MSFPKKFSPEYTAYINSAQWQAIRAEALKSHGRRCAGCMSSESIHMHHLFYPRDIWQTQAKHILPLCEACHKLTHDQQLFHPTVFSESECQAKRRQTIVYIQDRQRRLTHLARTKKSKVRPSEVGAYTRPSQDPVVIKLGPRYGPRTTKTRRFLSTSEQAYTEKLFKG